MLDVRIAMPPPDTSRHICEVARPDNFTHPRGRRRYLRQLAVSAALMISLAVAAQPCWSQDTSRTTDAVFTNPGARSIALGGAFAAIADDATAAFANPAGLVQILRPELSVELRGTASRTDHSSPYDLANSVSGLGFFSFVYPSPSWAVALYSHQLASLGFTIVDPFTLRRDFSVRSYAAAAAFEIGEHLSLGAGLSYFDGDRSPAAGVRGVSDTDWGLTAGVLWNPSLAWRVAGFYRQGPEFESTMDSNKRTLSPVRIHHTKAFADAARFTFPDEYGVGVAFKPKAGALTLSVEWDRVGSSVDPLHNGHLVTEAGSEYHLGAEYAVLRWKPVVAFRTGFWRESGRRHDVIADFVEEESFYSEGQTHMAFGFGLAFKRFQIDAGVDIWSKSVVGSVSFIFSF